MRQVYFSTVGAKRRNVFDFARNLIAQGAPGIELSGGSFSSQSAEESVVLASGNEVVLHNYFPIPVEPFVINLASLDEVISEKSINFVKKSILLSSMIGAKWYGVHAGFHFDPKPSELGTILQRRPLVDKRVTTELFVERIANLGEFARESGVRLLIENHVLSKSNFQAFHLENPLLMVTPNEMIEVISQTNSNVGILMDVGHLKVSGNTLGFDHIEALREVARLVEGYQLSENDGLQDQHLMFDESSWFFDILGSKVDYITFEVEDLDMTKAIELSKKLIESKLC